MATRDEKLQMPPIEKDRLSLLSNVSLGITSSHDLAFVLQEIVTAACALTEARYGALGIFDSSGHIQEFITHGTCPEERARIGDLPRGLGILGLLNDLQQPLRLADLTNNPLSTGFPAYHPPMRTFLGTPIRLPNEGVGNIYLTEKAGGQEFTPEDESLLVIFASQAASAIKNAQLFQHEHAALIEAERAITERRQADKENEVERQRLRALVEASPVGIIVIDAISGAVVFVNPEMERIFGFSLKLASHLERFERQIVFRRPDGRQYVPEDLPLQRALREGETVRAEEVRFEFPGGRTFAHSGYRR